MKIGLIGCGAICRQYLDSLSLAEGLTISACADRHEDRATSIAQAYGIARVLSPRDLIADPDIDVVLNLTSPLSHAAINLAAIEAGKHVYCEKPLAVHMQDGIDQVEAARRRGVLLGVAPDTVLGPGIQTCAKLIADGAIGRPLSAQAFMLSCGVETWHPNPVFYYKQGGGPLFDMGPYYLSALITMLGPVNRVQGAVRLNTPMRIIDSEPLRGQIIDVEVPTHIVGLLEFGSGALGALTTSFDVLATRLPPIEIHGTEGTLSAPDPNGFGGSGQIWSKATPQWKDVPLLSAGPVIGRGMGLVDFLSAIQDGRAPRANGDMALHVLEIMHGLHQSSEEGRAIDMRFMARPR